MLPSFIVEPHDRRWTQCLNELADNPSYIGVDSEFFENKHLRAIAEASGRDLDKKFDPWSTQLRCLQIGLPSGLVMLIDFGPRGFEWITPHKQPQCLIEVPGLDLIGQVLASRETSKIGWSLGTEALILRRHFGWNIRKPRDGMLASQVIWAGVAGKKRRWTHEGMKQQEPLGHSFKAAAERVGVEIDKTEQLSDWSVEELTDSQKVYAVTDVHRDTLIETWRRLYEIADSEGVADSVIVECEGAPAFWDCEWWGTPLDVSECNRLIGEYRNVGDKLRAEVSNALGGVPVEGDGSRSALALGLTEHLHRNGYPDACLYRWERRSTPPLDLDRKVWEPIDRQCSKCKVDCRVSNGWMFCPRCPFIVEYLPGPLMTPERAKPPKMAKPRKPSEPKLLKRASEEQRRQALAEYERKKAQYDADMFSYETVQESRAWQLMPMLGEKALAQYDNDPIIAAKLEAASCRSTEGKLEKRLSNSWDQGYGMRTRCRYFQIAGGFDNQGEASGAGAGMGRSSSGKPLNNQNETALPLGKKRHAELGLSNARSCVKPGEGRAFIVGDFSQAHMRFAAEVSQDPALCDDFRAGRDAHVRLAREFYCAQYPTAPLSQKSFSEWCDIYQKGKAHPEYYAIKVPRDPAKTVNYTCLNMGSEDRIQGACETAAEPIHLPPRMMLGGVEQSPWAFFRNGWRGIYTGLYAYQRETIKRADRKSHRFDFAEGEYGEVWSADGKRRLYLLKEWNVPKWEDAEGRYSVKGTDAVSAVWMMSEANALKIAAALCVAAFDLHPEWEAFICNIVHDELDVECSSLYSEPVARCVFEAMQEGLRRAGLVSIPTCAPDDTWEKMIVRSWADK